MKDALSTLVAQNLRAQESDANRSGRWRLGPIRLKVVPCRKALTGSQDWSLSYFLANSANSKEQSDRVQLQSTRTAHHLVERLFGQISRNVLAEVSPPTGAVEAMAQDHGTQIK
jgi:hypothetical protein